MCESKTHLFVSCKPVRYFERLPESGQFRPNSALHRKPNPLEATLSRNVDGFCSWMHSTECNWRTEHAIEAKLLTILQHRSPAISWQGSQSDNCCLSSSNSWIKRPISLSWKMPPRQINYVDLETSTAYRNLLFNSPSSPITVDGSHSTSSVPISTLMRLSVAAEPAMDGSS